MRARLGRTSPRNRHYARDRANRRPRNHGHQLGELPGASENRGLRAVHARSGVLCIGTALVGGYMVAVVTDLITVSRYVYGPPGTLPGVVCVVWPDKVACVRLHHRFGIVVLRLLCEGRRP